MNLKAASSNIMIKMEKSDSNFVNINKDDDDKVIRIKISPPRPQEMISLRPEEVVDLDARLLVQNYSNFKESREPGRVMYYDEDGSWVDYPAEEEVVDLVRRCFVEKNPFAEINLGGSRRLMDFYRMMEIEFDSGKGRSIAWIDVNGKCFFPKLFVNSLENRSDFRRGKKDNEVYFPEIELELKICEKGKEEEENEEEIETTGSSNHPVNGFWIGRNPIIASPPKWPNTRILSEQGPNDMQFKNFLLSMIKSAEPGATITNIHKCVRGAPLAKARLQVFKHQLNSMKERRGDPNLVFAWHGTSAQGVERILAHGFDMSNPILCPHGYGTGVLFSPVKFPHHIAMLSNVDHNGEKHIILCRVILGRSEKFMAGSQQRFSSYSEDFDSGVDSLENPQYYVMWPGNITTHILPEAVVSYKPGSTSNNDQLRGNLNLKRLTVGVSIPGLLSALKRDLPQSKVNELQAVYSSYKNGRMRRDIFARHLRTLVGNERLRSIIREIRG